MTRQTAVRDPFTKVIGDYKYELRVDENSVVRAFYRLTDSQLTDPRRIAARNLPNELKAEFAKLTGLTQEQLQI